MHARVAAIFDEDREILEAGLSTSRNGIEPKSTASGSKYVTRELEGYPESLMGFSKRLNKTTRLCGDSSRML